MKLKPALPDGFVHFVKAEVYEKPTFLRFTLTLVPGPAAPDREKLYMSRIDIGACRTQAVESSEQMI